MSDAMSKEGYNEEERYFREKEMELLRKKQAEAAKPENTNPHWMKCPKCGGDLAEVKIENVTVDRCGNCEGIYLDKGELEQLTRDNETGFFASLRKLF